MDPRGTRVDGRYMSELESGGIQKVIPVHAVKYIRFVLTVTIRLCACWVHYLLALPFHTPLNVAELRSEQKGRKSSHPLDIRPRCTSPIPAPPVRPTVVQYVTVRPATPAQPRRSTPSVTLRGSPPSLRAPLVEPIPTLLGLRYTVRPLSSAGVDPPTSRAEGRLVTSVEDISESYADALMEIDGIRRGLPAKGGMEEGDSRGWVVQSRL